MKKGIIICCISVFLSYNTACADTIVEERQRSYSQLWSSVCDKYGVPQSLAIAIARVESRLHPWAVNIEGKSFYYDSHDEALSALEHASLQGKSYDIGFMQINNYWLRRFKLTPRQVLNPYNNITLGVWILAQEIGRYGLSWDAVGSYHTPIRKNPKNARRYVDNVKAELEVMQREVE